MTMISGRPQVLTKALHYVEDIRKMVLKLPDCSAGKTHAPRNNYKGLSGTSTIFGDCHSKSDLLGGGRSDDEELDRGIELQRNSHGELP